MYSCINLWKKYKKAYNVIQTSVMLIAIVMVSVYRPLWTKYTFEKDYSQRAKEGTKYFNKSLKTY